MELKLTSNTNGEKQKHNKLFKSDSQRVAFSRCVVFGVSGGMRWHRYCVAHTLTGRYMP